MRWRRRWRTQGGHGQDTVEDIAEDPAKDMVEGTAYVHVFSSRLCETRIGRGSSAFAYASNESYQAYN